MNVSKKQKMILLIGMLLLSGQSVKAGVLDDLNDAAGNWAGSAAQLGQQSSDASDADAFAGEVYSAQSQGGASTSTSSLIRQNAVKRDTFADTATVVLSSRDAAKNLITTTPSTDLVALLKQPKFSIELMRKQLRGTQNESNSATNEMNGRMYLLDLMASGKMQQFITATLGTENKIDSLYAEPLIKISQGTVTKARNGLSRYVKIVRFLDRFLDAIGLGNGLGNGKKIKTPGEKSQSDQEMIRDAGKDAQGMLPDIIVDVTPAKKSGAISAMNKAIRGNSLEGTKGFYEDAVALEAQKTGRKPATESVLQDRPKVDQAAVDAAKERAEERRKGKTPKKVTFKVE